jgi:hypothetical protein
MQTEKEDSFGSQETFSILRNVIFIAAIYCYFTGWTYSFYLFNHFGISINSVDIPFYYFFIYSYSVITNISAIIAIIATPIVILLVNSFAPNFLKKLVPPFILIVLFLISFSIARQRANEESLSIRTGYAKTIIFVFKKDGVKFYSKEFMDANNNGKLKLLTQTNDRFYVIYQPAGKGKAIPCGSIYDIARADIHLTKIVIPDVMKK